MSIQDLDRSAGDVPIAVAGDDWTLGPADPLAARRGGPLGAPMSRVDGPKKVSGAAPFAAEFPLDGMLYAALVFSTVAKGRIAHLDTSTAEAAEGVALVMTYRNAPRLQAPPMFLTQPNAASGDDVPVMQDAEIRWNGQPVALVLAQTQEQADHASSLVDVRYEAEPIDTVFDEAKKHPHEASPTLGPMHIVVGDAEVALTAAEHTIDVTYTTPPFNHNAIEPHAVTAVWDGDQLRLHDSTQAVDWVAGSLAHIFGIAEDRIRVTAPFVGGGFGGKILWQHQTLAVAAAKVAGRPVRLSLSREGVYRLVGGRARTEQRVVLGSRADGRLEALIHEGVNATSPHSGMPEPFIQPAQCMYRAGAIKLDLQVVHLDMTANTFMRAPGESVGTFALESAMDELAVELGLDPIELRIRNEPTEDPTSGRPFSSRHLVEAYRSGAERFGWSRRHTEPGTQRIGDWLVGMGVASATYPYQRMPGGAARIALRRNGRVGMQIAAHEMGMGTATTQAQVVAERLAVPVEGVTVEYGDSALPGNVLAAGSQQSVAIGASVVAAHRSLVAALLELVPDDSPLAGADIEDVGVRDCGLCRLDDPSAFVSYDEILDAAQRAEVSVEAAASEPKEAAHWSMHSYGAVFSEVRVDSVTGEVRVSRLLGSYDVGRILNAKTALSQFRGGMIMGMGMALMEATEIDERTGRVMNPSLAEYHVPVHLDVPEIEATWTDIPDPQSPMGARGIGEIGITGTAASIANAVYNATGRRVRNLPITLDKVV